MTMTTRKTNAMAHPGAPDLPTTSRRSSRQVAAEKKAAEEAQLAQTRLALEKVYKVAIIEAEMAQEDAFEQENAARHTFKLNDCELHY
jgi:hypothetical protein